MKDTVWLEKMSWPEVERALAAGKTTVIIGVGSIEQHGPHMAVATDALLSEILAERLAERLGNALVAPVIRPGCSDHHMAFPGTISFSSTLLQEIVVTYCRCLAVHGFKRLVLMSTHGGNFHPVDVAATRARAELLGQGVQIVSLTDLDGFVDALVAPLRELGLQQDVILTHADLAETSLLLAVHPELVEPELAERGFMGTFDTMALLRDGLKDGGLRRLSPNGILGDARGATPEIGHQVIASVVDYLYRACQAQS